MKKILRSIINVDGTLSKENLRRNLFFIAESELEFVKKEDEQIWEFIYDYAMSYAESPSMNTIRDHFEEEKEFEVLDRLKEIEALNNVYTQSDFENLVRENLKNQYERKTQHLLKEAAHILTDGKTEGQGQEKEHYKGHQDALRYILEEADNLMSAGDGAEFRSNIANDADKMRKKFRHVVNNMGNAFGRGVGLDPIDKVCKGLKPGELWLHAGFTSELKCCSPSTKVYDHTQKSLRTVKEVYEGNDLPTLTTLKSEGKEGPELSTHRASHIEQNGVRDVYKVTLKSGRSIEITDNHPLWTDKNGGSWADLTELEEGDWVGTPEKMEINEPRQDFSDEEVKVVGYLLGDGSIHNDIKLHSSNRRIRNDFKKSLSRMGLKEGKADYKTASFQEAHRENRVDFVRVSYSSGEGNSEMESPVKNVLDRLDLWRRRSNDKFIPDEFFGLPENQVELLLGALWSTDGSCCNKKIEGERRKDITYASISEDLARGVQRLLLRLGIQSSIKEVEGQYNGEPYTFWQVRVTTIPSKKKFCEKVNVTGKESQFESLLETLPEKDDRRFPVGLIEHLDDYDRSQTETGSWKYAGQQKERESLTGASLRYFAEQVDPDLHDHLEGDVAWDKIESIEHVGEKMTYDVSVPEDHSFVANQMITHNTTFALNWAYKQAFIFHHNVYYISLEMSVEKIRDIIYVMHSSHPKFRKQGYEPLNYRKIRDGVDDEGNKLTQEEKDFYKTVMDDVDNCDEYGRFEVECPKKQNATIPQIKNRMEMYHQSYPIDIAFLDYFGLVQPHRNLGSYYQELNSIIRSAKQMCMNFNNGEKLPLVALHQINREGKKEAEKNDGVYTKRALADANEAERTSDVISYTYLNEDLRDRGEVKIGCLKNRDNPFWEPFHARVDFRNRYIYNLIHDDDGNTDFSLPGT